MKKINNIVFCLMLTFCFLLTGCLPHQDYFRRCDDNSYMRIQCVYDLVDLITKDRQVCIKNTNEEALYGTYDVVQGDEKEMMINSLDFERYETEFDNDERYIYISEDSFIFLFLFNGYPEEYEEKLWLVITFDTNGNSIEEFKVKLNIREDLEKNGEIVYSSLLSDLHTYRISEDNYEEFIANNHITKPKQF